MRTIFFLVLCVISLSSFVCEKEIAITSELQATADKINVYIRNTGGTEDKYNVSKNMTVKELKEIYAKEKGKAVEKLIFMFNGKTLVDSDTLAESGLVEGSRINVLVKP